MFYAIIKKHDLHTNDIIHIKTIKSILCNRAAKQRKEIKKRDFNQDLKIVILKKSAYNVRAVANIVNNVFNNKT